MNPIYKLIQMLPINGWTTAIGGSGMLLLGVGGYVVSLFRPEDAAMFCANGLSPEMSLTVASAGLGLLGVGNKLDKASQ